MAIDQVKAAELRMLETAENLHVMQRLTFFVFSLFYQLHRNGYL